MKIKICVKAKNMMNKLEQDRREFKELKAYMYEDICPKCGASPTYQKTKERFVYCKSCGFTLDVEECDIVQ